MERRTEKSIYGWTGDFPPRFDEDPDVSLDVTTLPLQVYKAGGPEQPPVALTFAAARAYRAGHPVGKFPN